MSHIKISTASTSPQVDMEAVPDRRTSGRYPLYMQDSANVEITTHKGLVFAKIVDLGVNGLGLGLMDASQWDLIQIGDEVELQVEIRQGERSWPLHGQITHMRFMDNYEGKYLHLGVKLNGTTYTAMARKRLAGFVAYRCPDLMNPIAFCPDPILLGELVHFQVRAICPAGFVTRTSFRNKTLFPGLHLNLSIMIPNVGEFSATVQILDVRIDEEEPKYQVVEMAFLNAESSLLAALGEFVLMISRDASVTELRQQGFFLDTIFRAIRLGYAISDDDWRDILDLRLQAYHSVGKCLDKKEPHDMRDSFDRYSRQIVAQVGGRIVGAARVVFVGNDPQRSEHTGLGITVPKDIVAAGFVEFSRFCALPEFRGADVFIALMRQATLVAVHSNVRYVVANCNPDLWQVYKNLGFRKVGPSFSAFGRDDCSLIVSDIEDTVLKGKKSGVVTWNQVVLPVQRFYSQTTKQGGWHPWVLMQRLLSPLINLLRIRKRWNKFQQDRSRRKGFKND